MHTRSRVLSASVAFGLGCAAVTAAVLAVAAAAGMAGAELVLPVFLTVATTMTVVFYYKTRLFAELREQRLAMRRQHAALTDQVRQAQGFAQLAAFHTPYPLPLGGAWALTPDAAVVLVQQIALRRPGLVVELGSGASTILTGRLLRAQGRGRLLSIDHDPQWAEETRRHVAANGLGDIVTVLEAPLKRQDLPEVGECLWYDLPAEAREVAAIDLLLVDGPPSTAVTAGLPRYPALPVFLPRLASGAVVFVDDARRPQETEMVRQWLSRYPGWRQQVFDTVPGTVLLLREA